MATQRPSSLVVISPLITAQLAVITGVTSNRVLINQREKPPDHLQGDQDILVRYGPPQPEPGFSHGAGRVACVISRGVQVTPRTRWAVDQSDRDDAWVQDPTYGHLNLEEACVNALHIWFPADLDGNFLSVEPIHWIPGAAPIRETPVNSSWGHTDLMFHLRYQLALPSNGF